MTQIEYNLPDYEYHDKEIHPHISSSDVKPCYIGQVKSVKRVLPLT
jgi:hypothetical protein